MDRPCRCCRPSELLIAGGGEQSAIGCFFPDLLRRLERFVVGEDIVPVGVAVRKVDQIGEWPRESWARRRRPPRKLSCTRAAVVIAARGRVPSSPRLATRAGEVHAALVVGVSTCAARRERGRAGERPHPGQSERRRAQSAAASRCGGCACARSSLAAYRSIPKREMSFESRRRRSPRRPRVGSARTSA